MVHIVINSPLKLSSVTAWISVFSDITRADIVPLYYPIAPAKRNSRAQTRDFQVVDELC